MIRMQMTETRESGIYNRKVKARLLTALIVVMPILSLLAGAAFAAHQYGVF